MLQCGADIRAAINYALNFVTMPHTFTVVSPIWLISLLITLLYKCLAAHLAPPSAPPLLHILYFYLWEAKALSVLAAFLHTNCSFVSGEPLSLQGWRRRSENKKKNKTKKSGGGRKREKEMSRTLGGGSKGPNNKEKEPHQRKESNQKKKRKTWRGTARLGRINEVFFEPPVALIGRHGVPVGTITGPSGKRQRLCPWACVHA